MQDSNSTVEGVESRLNSLHASINILLAAQGFDLKTKEGVKAASKYLTENAKNVSFLAKSIYKRYKNKKKKENDENN